MYQCPRSTCKFSINGTHKILMYFLITCYFLFLKKKKKKKIEREITGNFISVWRGSCVKITKIFIFIFLRNPIPKNLKKKKKKGSVCT